MQRLFSLVAIVLAAVTNVFAQSSFTETFPYPNGNLVGQGPAGTVWTAIVGSSGNTVQVAANAISLATSGQDPVVPWGFTIGNGSRVYAGFDLRVSAAGTGDYFFALTGTNFTSTGGGICSRLFIKASGVGYVLGYVTGTGGTPVYSSRELAFGTTYRVVVRYDSITGAGNKRGLFYIDPVDLVNEAANTPEIAAQPDTTAGSNTLAALIVRQGSVGLAAVVSLLDNLAISSAYNLAAPSPGGSGEDDPASVAITLGGLSQIYDGTGKAITTTTVPAGVAVDVTYNGSPTPPVLPGSYAVVATVADPVTYSGTASGTLVITGAPVVITLGNLTQVYDGSPKSATISTVPSCVALTVTYDNNPTLPTNAGSYTVRAVSADITYNGSVSGVLTISKAPATVTLSGLSHTYDGAAHPATVTTSPAGLAVEVTYNGGVTASSVTTASYTFGDIPVPANRGPNGLHWPSDTPAYTTAATKFATPATINTVLATCVSGDVIEVSGAGTINVILTGGSDAWAQNVLIRPAIGERGRAADFDIRATHVTVAGFHLVTTARIGIANGATQAGARSYFARCTLAQETQVTINNADDAGIYEVVAETYGTGIDRVHLSASGTGTHCNRFKIVGCWLKGKWVGIDSLDHADTVQYVVLPGADPVDDPLIEDSVIFCSANVPVQVGSGTIRRMVWRNCWMNSCQNRTEDPPPGFKGEGFIIANSAGVLSSCFNSTILGSVGSGNPWQEVRDTVYGTFGAINVASGNTPGQTSITQYPYTPLANLATIWGN